MKLMNKNALQIIKEIQMLQWNNDEYRDLKWMIFDLLRRNIYKGHQDDITVAMLCNGIDKLFEDLIKESNEN
jgi:hypothetical protein